MKKVFKFIIPLVMGIVNWLIFITLVQLYDHSSSSIVTEVVSNYALFSFVTSIVAIIVGIVLQIKSHMTTSSKILLILGYIINLLYLIEYLILAYAAYQSHLHF